METLLLTKTKGGMREPRLKTCAPLPGRVSGPTGLENECDGGLPEPGRNNVEAHPSRSVDPEEELPTEAELLFDVVVRVLRRL